jgi:hypothetical protein
VVINNKKDKGEEDVTWPRQRGSPDIFYLVHCGETLSAAMTSDRHETPNHQVASKVSAKQKETAWRNPMLDWSEGQRKDIYARQLDGMAT